MEKAASGSSKYGWVVVMAFFLAEVIIDGIRFSFGIFFVEFLNAFQRGRAETAFVGSMLAGTYNLCGPVYALVIHRFGCRAASMIGSLLTATGFLLTVHAKNLYYLIVTFGCMQGFGFGLMVMSGTVAVGRYFVKNRSVAIGIGLCGSGFGTFIFPPFLRIIIDNYTWRGGLFIVAGIALHGCVLGALYRPIVVAKNDLKETSFNEKTLNNHKHNATENQYEKTQDCKTEIACDTKLIDTMENTELVKPVALDLDIKERTHKYALKPLLGKDDTECKPRNVLYFNADEGKEFQKLKAGNLNNGSHRSLNLAVYNSLTFGSTRALNETHDDEGTIEIEQYHFEEETKSSFSIQFIENMFPKILITDIRLTLAMCAAFLFGMPSFTPITIVPDFAISVGCDPSNAMWLISAIGIGSTVGRAGAGWVADRSCSNRNVMLRMSFSCCGFFTMLFAALTNFIPLVVCSFFYGVFFGATFTIQPVVNMDLFGAHHIAQLVGMQMMMYGLAQLVGNPVAGLLYDFTGEYRISFLFAGGVSILSACVHVLLVCCKQKGTNS